MENNNISRHEVCKKLQAATCSICVELDGEIISKGSGWSVNPDGIVCTAAHVLTGRVPLRIEDIEDLNMKYWVKFMGFPEYECKVALPLIMVKGEIFQSELILDIATLVPKSKITFQLPFLTTLLEAPTLGDIVYFAGFSDEIELPFLGGKLSNKLIGVDDFQKQFNRNGNVDMVNIMIKQGIVGNIRQFVFGSSEQNSEMKGGEIFYIDNAMHSGASGGGPVVNESGKVIGLITKRAVTKVSKPEDNLLNLAVPSGSTECLTLKPLNVLPRKNV